MGPEELCLPVARFVLDRAEVFLDRIEASGRPDLLDARLAGDMFPAGAQISIAVGYTLRIALPLAGRPVPELPEATDLAGLRARIAAAREVLGGLSDRDFDGAETRRVIHRAGFADLDQDGAAFLRDYGLPNMYFHLAMAYAALRAAGLPLGKGDFDGLHAYPAGFSFHD